MILTKPILKTQLQFDIAVFNSFASCFGKTNFIRLRVQTKLFFFVKTLVLLCYVTPLVVKATLTTVWVTRGTPPPPPHRARPYPRLPCPLTQRPYPPTKLHSSFPPCSRCIWASPPFFYGAFGPLSLPPPVHGPRCSRGVIAPSTDSLPEHTKLRYKYNHKTIFYRSAQNKHTGALCEL